jgi:hypothetical protein
MAPRSWPKARGIFRKCHMRLFFGIILGCALTIGAAYIADSTNAGSTTARPMVNWDVVAKNVDRLTEFARESWKKIAG